MNRDRLIRIAKEIDYTGLHELDALELQGCLYNAGVGLHRQSLEVCLKEVYFVGLLAPVAWKRGRGSKQPDKTNLLNIARWKRGSAFDDYLNGTASAAIGDDLDGSPTSP